MPDKIEWTNEMIAFIKSNYEKLSNRQLAKALNLSLHAVRKQCYTMGLLRMNLEYWTEEQVKFLKANYQQIGDKELAEIFNSKWQKNKDWTLKHIEKKRKYLHLKRTKEELKAIHQRNVDAGRFLLCPVKRWLVSGVAKEGEIRMWRENLGRYVPHIKINGKFIPWNRWAWEQNFGPVPQGMNVVFKDDDPWHIDPHNLEIISDAELSRRNSKKSSVGLSDNYIAGILSHGRPDMREELLKHREILEIKRLQLQLNRTIYEQQTIS